jgi:hypothetical protein
MNHQLTNANKKWRLTPLGPLSYVWPNQQLVTKAGQVFIRYGLWNIPTLLVMCRIKPSEEGCAEEIRDPCEVGAKTGPHVPCFHSAPSPPLRALHGKWPVASFICGWRIVKCQWRTGRSHRTGWDPCEFLNCVGEKLLLVGYWLP